MRLASLLWLVAVAVAAAAAAVVDVVGLVVVG
jgi:hypothetical protein